jgi:DNA-binding CsgD family transcriptional regulator
MAAASAMRRPSLRHRRVLGVADSLDAAERAGLIRIDGRTVSFTHPLYAAAAYDGLSAGERMRLHARIADVVEGEEERARHLALAADEADEAVAAALDVARERAMRRGALDAALDASTLALRATPSGSALLTERRIHLGNLLFRAGETDRARRELTLAADRSEEALNRARALHALARVVNDTEGPVPAMPLELQALSLAGNDDNLTADIHMGIAVSNSDDWDVALEHAHTARKLLEKSPEPDHLRMAAALAAEVGARFYAGGGADFDALHRAIELQDGDVSLPVADRALSVLFYLQMWTDDFPAARAQLDYAYQLADEEGDEPSRCYILGSRVNLEVRAGLWERAEALIGQCLETAEMSQNPYYARSMATHRAWIGAYRGDLDAAVAAAEDEVRRGVAAGNSLIEQRGRALRGWCSLAAGDVSAAAADLDRYAQLFDDANTGEPALRLLGTDHVEALVLAGRIDDAERVLTDLVEPAKRLGRTAVLAGAARVEAVLRAEQGDAEAAIAAAERALEHYAKIERRLERARALLTKGQVHRRFKQKSLAKRELTAALELFEGLGAGGFATRTRTELSRIGLRPPAATGLTETERRIAELTATGRTSAEIAGVLFLSTKTVSANLTRIYRKLNVRNRAELTALLAARE